MVLALLQEKQGCGSGCLFVLWWFIKAAEEGGIFLATQLLFCIITLDAIIIVIFILIDSHLFGNKLGRDGDLKVELGVMMLC